MCGLVNILVKSKSLTLMHLLSQIMRNEKHFVEGIYERTLKSKTSFKAGKFGSTTQIKKWGKSIGDPSVRPAPKLPELWEELLRMVCSMKSHVWATDSLMVSSVGMTGSAGIQASPAV